jgi:ADP-heptose:LPS heptosyltransferase
VPDDARRRARALVETGTRPLVGIHASGGRQSKQWHLDRFAATGRAVAARTGATIVLTGSAADRAMVEDVAARLAGVHVISTPGQVDLPDLAGLLSELDVLVTGDTGPMHLAAAVGTPVVALFGPSDPARYGPLAPVERIVRVHLPCSPCGQVRLPPVRCRGHVPDCLDGITVDVVVGHVLDVLTGRSARREERP